MGVEEQSQILHALFFYYFFFARVCVCVNCVGFEEQRVYVQVEVEN